MISLKVSNSEKQDAAQTSVIDDKPSYPYGCRIYLGPEELKKLGLTGVPEIGKKMTLTAIVEIVSANVEKEIGDSKEYGVSLQMTDAEISSPEKKSAADNIYKKEV